jgi:hypothetical protein
MVLGDREVTWGKLHGRSMRVAAGLVAASARSTIRS